MTIRRLKRSRLVWLGLALATPCTAQTTQPVGYSADRMLEDREWQRIGHPIEVRSERPDRREARLGVEGGDEDKTKAIEALGENPLATVFDAIGADARLYAQHNITLSNPFMEGRIPGSAGNRIAADYIEFWFRKYNLQPAFAATSKAADGAEVVTANASFRQTFQHGSTVRTERQTVTLHPSGREDMKLEPGKDFTVLGMSGSGKVKGDVVFCGYGIDGPDGYKTFEGNIDLSGKIAMVFRFEPMKPDGTSRWAERGWSPAAGLDAKLKAVAERKPAAIVLVNPPGAADPRAKELIAPESLGDEPSKLGVPVVMITTEAAERLAWFNGTMRDFRERVDEAGMVRPLTDARASIDVEIRREPVLTDNVGAVLPGRGDLAKEYIVIGAHYDHVGYGTIGANPSNRGKLHPGADDNASGTAGVLLLAHKLSDSYAKLPKDASARSVIFLLFSAEESGLNGSIYYVNHPSVELSSIQFMLNMDMIGRLRSKASSPKANGLDVEGTQSAEGLYDLVKPLLDASGIEIRHGTTIAANTDHFSFYSKQIPILNFFTGYHDQYHKPEDTFDLINHTGAARIIAMAHDICLTVAQHPQKLKFTARRPSRNAAAAPPPPPAPPPPAAESGAARAGGNVRFGIKPGTYEEESGGVEVVEVYEGTSAADAGIREGDVMIKWNGKPIGDVQAWMPLLRASKVGDVVEVTVKRDGKEQVIKVTLKAGETGSR